MIDLKRMLSILQEARECPVDERTEIAAQIRRDENLGGTASILVDLLVLEPELAIDVLKERLGSKGNSVLV